jgi:hypothetical protein
VDAWVVNGMSSVAEKHAVWFWKTNAIQIFVLSSHHDKEHGLSSPSFLFVFYVVG